MVRKYHSFHLNSCKLNTVLVDCFRILSDTIIIFAGKIKAEMTFSDLWKRIGFRLLSDSSSSFVMDSIFRTTRDSFVKDSGKCINYTLLFQFFLINM